MIILFTNAKKELGIENVSPEDLVGMSITKVAFTDVYKRQGYARVSGKVGVCLVTSGPGATNTITGIADAMIDSTPIVVIAGQVGTGFLGTDAFQEVDLVGITQPISKWSYQIRRAEEVAWAVARAFYLSLIHIVYIADGGNVLLDKQHTTDEEEEATAPELNLRKVYDFALTAPLDEIRFILDTARLNKAAAEQAFKGNYGHSLGRMLRGSYEHKVMGDSVFSHILSYTSAACDARMARCV